MKTLTLNDRWSRSSRWARSFSLVALAAGAWALSGAVSQARAGDVVWSVGVHSPGVVVGVSNAPPVVVRHRPVVVYEAPVVYQRRPYVVERVVERVVVREPVYVSRYERRLDRRWDKRQHKHYQKWHKRQHRHDHDD